MSMDNTVNTPLVNKEQSVADYILAEKRKGNVVIRELDCLMSMPLDDFVTQPVDGILYDLNRSEEVVLTFIDDPKWVNDFAVAQTIRKLVEQRDLARTLEAACEGMAEACEALSRCQVIELSGMFTGEFIEARHRADIAVASYRALKEAAK